MRDPRADNRRLIWQTNAKPLRRGTTVTDPTGKQDLRNYVDGSRKRSVGNTVRRNPMLPYPVEKCEGHQIFSLTFNVPERKVWYYCNIEDEDVYTDTLEEMRRKIYSSLAVQGGGL